MTLMLVLTLILNLTSRLVPTLTLTLKVVLTSVKRLLIRLQNKTVLTSLISGIMLILVNTGVIDVEMSQKVDTVVNTVLYILVAMGIVSDPESHLKK
jgi:uncharacterized membrane protein